MAVDLEAGIIDTVYAEAVISLAGDAETIRADLLRRNAKSEVRRLLVDYPGLGGVGGVTALSVPDRDRFNIGAGCFAAALYVLGPGGRDVLARMTEYKSGRVTKKWGNLKEQSVDDIADALRDEGRDNLAGIDGAGAAPVAFSHIALSGASHRADGSEPPRTLIEQVFGPPYGSSYGGYRGE